MLMTRAYEFKYEYEFKRFAMAYGKSVLSCHNKFICSDKHK